VNLKNKSTGRIVPVPPAEPEETWTYVSVVNGELRMREDGRGPLLTEDDIVHRAEEARRAYLRDLERSTAWTVFWFVICGLITIAAGAWVVQYMRDVFAVKP
jgi:hypothetical protein